MESPRRRGSRQYGDAVPAREGIRRELLLFGWLAVVLTASTLLTRQRMIDWKFSVAGGHTLFSRRWAHLLADNPNAQTGPLTHALAWPIDHLGIGSAKAVIYLLGLTVLGLLVWAARGLPDVVPRLAVGGAAFAAWWPQIGSFGHLDDALVLVLTVLAVWATLLGHQRRSGLLAGLALGAKPTAVFLLALTLPFRAWRTKDAWAPLLLAVVVALVVYGPFIAGADAGLAALRPKVFVRPDAVLGLVVRHGTRPSSVFRTGQLVAVLGASAWAMRRHGAAAVTWMGVSARLLLDPGAWAYYTVGFVLGALLWDLVVTRRRMPWATVVCALLLAPPWLIADDTARAWLRLVACLGAIVVVAATRPSERCDASICLAVRDGNS